MSAAALPAIGARSRSTEPPKPQPWKGSDPTGVASSRRERGAAGPRAQSTSPVGKPVGKPDSLQWQRSMGVRRGGKDQMSGRSQRKSMIDGAGARLEYQQPRKEKGKGKGRLKQIEPADSFEAMEVALHRNRVVRKNEGRRAKINYSEGHHRTLEHAAAKPLTTSALSGIDDEPLPELGAADGADGAEEQNSWKLENQTAYLATVRAVNDPREDEVMKQAALRIQRFFRKVTVANSLMRQSIERPGSSSSVAFNPGDRRARLQSPGLLLLRPESRQEPLPSLETSSMSLWDDVGEDAVGDFKRSKPLHRLVNGEDSSRLRFYQLYSEHLDWMDEENHAQLGLNRVQEEGSWRREEIISILHHLLDAGDGFNPQDIRERCATVGIVLGTRESADADVVRGILRENLKQHKQRADEQRASPRTIGGGAQTTTAVDPDARTKRLELMSKQGSAHHQFLEECLQRSVHPLPIMLQQDRKGDEKGVMNLAHYRMGDEIAAALAAGLNKRAEHMQIETLILTDNKLTGPQDRIGSRRKQKQQQGDGAGFLSSGAEALALIIMQNADSITHLDLSENPLGPSGCQVLAKTFANSSQALAVETLRLNNCKLGDKGTRSLLRLLGEWCPYLNYLDIGRNNLGQGGSAALAIEEILVEETVPLSTLSLNYNNFGEKHMRRFALAIPENTFLTHLDLSWNSVGCAGAMLLAQSLRTNGTLRILDVTHDNIQEKGAFVLADMLKENKGLEKLILSDNPIGQRGGRAMLRALDRMVELGTAQTRAVILSQCNYNYSTAEQIFDPANPGGYYECDLTNPYERAVAWELVELAWKEEGENWDGETIDNQPFDLLEPEVGEVWGRDPSFGPGKWYQLPAEGVLRVTYIQTPKVPRFADCIDAEMVDKLIELMSDKLINDNGTMLVNLASFDFYFTAQIACTLTILTRDTLNKITAMSALIPRIIDPINMSSDCYDWMTVSEISALEGRAPDLFNFIPTNPTNHYKLELGRTDHKRLLTRLVCICAEEKTFREKHNMYDTSQKGDGEGWRNETMTTSEELMGPPIINGNVDWNSRPIQYAAYHPVPWDIDEEDCTGGRLKYGTLEFDFVSTNVGHRIVGQKPMPLPVFRLFLKELASMEDLVTVLDDGSSSGKTKRKAGARKKRGDSTVKVKRTKSKDGEAGGGGGGSGSSAKLKRNKSTRDSSEAAGGGGGETKGRLKTMLRQQSKVVAMSAFQGGKPVTFSVQDLKQIAKIQSLIRGKIHRNSTAGIKLTAHVTLKKKATSLIHAERLKFQRYSNNRAQAVQEAKQVQKEAAQARAGTGANDSGSDSGGLGKAHSGAGGLAALSKAAARFGKSAGGGEGLTRTYTASPGAATMSPKERVDFFRAKISPAHRPCWWTPSQEKRMSATSVSSAKKLRREKQLQMLRRSTMQYFFSSEQVKQILEVIDEGPAKYGHVEALVILFAVITDIERVEFPKLLGHVTYDKDGNHIVDWDELAELRQERNPWVVLESRLGPANLFNPIRPEREYALDLRLHDCRMVAQCLVILSAEPGENLLYTSYNGLPFDVGAKWIDAVPELGMFCGEFTTPEHCALMSLRLSLARMILMPGFGRWRAVPLVLRDPQEDCHACEASIGYDRCVIDADGSLIEKPDDEEDDMQLSLGGLLGALRFSRRIKKAAAKRLHKLKVRRVDTKQAAPLSLIVKLSLAAQRAQSKVAASSKSDDAHRAAAVVTDFNNLQTLIEGETVERPPPPPPETDETSVGQSKGTNQSAQQSNGGGRGQGQGQGRASVDAGAGAVAAGIAGSFTSALIHRPGGLQRDENEDDLRASLGLAPIET